MRLDNLKQLYLHELRDLHSAKKQMLDALPRIQKTASNDELKKVLGEHADATRDHVRELDRIFANLDESPEGKICRGMAGMIRECDEMMKIDAEDAVRDAGLVANVQRMEHYEMAGYGAARTYAEMLGENEAEKALQGILDRDGRMNKRLTELARQHVNPQVEHAS